MKEISVTITGTTPLLMNRFSDEFMAGDSPNTVHRGTLSPMEAASKLVYLDLQGKPIIPQPNLLRCIIDGGVFFKMGKSKVTTKDTSLITACISLDEVYYPLLHKEPWTVDTRPVRNPSTGGRILKHRPCFNDWSIEFTVMLDDSMMDEKLLRDIIDASGKKIGLGDFRVHRKGPFGKFVVTKWDSKPLPASAN